MKKQLILNLMQRVKMFERFNIRNSMPFSLKYNSNHEYVVATAEKIWESMTIDKRIKPAIKMKCLIACLINLKLGLSSLNYICYSRRGEHYSNLPVRYRRDYYTYDIMRGVFSALDTLGITETKLGFINLNDKSSRQTKVRINDDYIETLCNIDNKMIEDIAPPELIVLKQRGRYADKINYIDDKETNAMRKDLIAYNELRQSSTLTLNGVNVNSLNESGREFINLYGVNINEDEIIKLRNPYVYRVFNETFKLGGRFYGSIEASMNSELRNHLCINGNKTVEKDFACVHIRMLYNKKKLDLKEDAYDMLTDGDENLRDLYKLIGLVSINSKCKENALNGIRYEISKRYRSKKKNMKINSKKNYNLIKLFPNLSDSSIDVYYQKWVDAHSKISKYLNSDIGIKLQNKDSKIASGVINHFTKKDIPVLVVHDSFLIEEKYEDELVDVMNKEYYKLFKFNPVIK